MYRGRTSFPVGAVFGHEQTGRVVEVGPEVHRVKVGDWVSIPFNVSCGLCTNCKERKTNLCLDANDMKIGGAYGFADVSLTYADTPSARLCLLLSSLSDTSCLICCDRRLLSIVDGRSARNTFPVKSSGTASLLTLLLLSVLSRLARRSI